MKRPFAAFVPLYLATSSAFMGRVSRQPSWLLNNDLSTALFSQRQDLMPSYRNRLLQLERKPGNSSTNVSSSSSFLPQDEELLTITTIAEQERVRSSRLYSSELDQADGIPKNTQRKILAEIIRDPRIEVAGAVLVLLSSFVAAVSTVNSIDLSTMAALIRVENIVAFIFAIEFFVRWYTQFTWKGILKYLTQPLVLVDLVVVILPLVLVLVSNSGVSGDAYSFLPSWLTSTSGLVNLRLLRVLRLQRVLVDMDTFAEFQKALGVPQTDVDNVYVQPYKLQLARVVLSVFTLLSISTGLIYTTEHAVNPAIPDYFTALYFGLTTLTTVGFGDITPVTTEGKLVVSGSILAGVAVIPVQAAALVDALLAREDVKKSSRTTTSTSTSTSTSTRQRETLSNNNNNNNHNGRSTMNNSPIMLNMKCTNCDANFHWTAADYCWSCGSKLPDDELA
jgi:voltage-gated potassium channel Kch